MTSYNRNFKFYLIIQSLMQAALWIVIIQLPIYVAQKDAVGGLQWDHNTKGWIFFWWVLFQNIAAISFGYFADKWKLKSSLILSHSLQTIGYLLLAYSRDFYGIILAVVILGSGTGIFKPVIQGAIANSLDENNSSKGWGLFILVINIAVIISTFLAGWLQEISWSMVFIGSAIIILLNGIFIYLIPESSNDIKIETNKFSDIFSKELFRSDVIYPVIILSGFTLIYMQFYEMLPNYIYDWVNSESLVKYFPNAWVDDMPRGKMINYLYIYLINPILVILLVYPISSYSSNKNKYKFLSIGLLFVLLGIIFSGSSQIIYLILIGFVIYTLGEMIVRPKFQEIMSDLAPAGKKSLYMSFLQLSYAIGYLIGARTGGIVYDNYGEKAGFAKKYLLEKYYVNIEIEKAYSKLVEISGLTHSEITDLLFTNYEPWRAWAFFWVVGLITFTAFIFIRKR